jgi:hypothetical protein
MQDSNPIKNSSTQKKLWTKVSTPKLTYCTTSFPDEKLIRFLYKIPNDISGCTYDLAIQNIRKAFDLHFPQKRAM